jgi:hypothetical protein
MRKEAMSHQTPTWNLQRIPVTPKVVHPSISRYGVTLTEIEPVKNDLVSVGYSTGYPYVSLKK